MTLRALTLLIITVALLVVIAIMALASNLILLQSYSDLEVRDIRNDVERVRRLLRDEIANLDSTAKDWASWDDSYRFIRGQDQTYIEENLLKDVYLNLHISLFLYVDRAQNVQYATAIDLFSGQIIDIRPGLETFMRRYAAVFQEPSLESRTAGFAAFNGMSMLFAARPITPSYRNGPAAGTLLLGRFLTDEEVARLGEKAQLNLTLRPLDGPTPSTVTRALQATFTAPDPQTADEHEIVVEPHNNATVSGHTVLDDVHGVPLLLLSVDAPREIYSQGQVTIQYMLALFASIGLLSALITLVIVERGVFTRVYRLIENVRRVARQANPSERVAVEGPHELNRLARSINDMLAALERSQTELARSVAENRAIMQAIPDVMLRIGPDGIIRSASVPRGLSADYDLSPFIGSKVTELKKVAPWNWSPIDEENGLEALLSVMRDQQLRIFDLPSEVSGTKRDLEIRLSAVQDEYGGVLAVVRDVTQRRQAEFAERSMLLLREIHHRIKNNLQVVSSLLSLQAAQVNDPAVALMFQDSQNRVRTMALIHEKLHHARDTGRIDFGDYLHDLTDYLASTYQVSARLIRVQTEAEAIFFDVDIATSCGLIVNELVSNAFKHAFPGQHVGTLVIRLESRPEGAAAIVVADDGIGLPAEIDVAQASTLGLQLVHSLVRQIHAGLSIQRGQGTRFEIVVNTGLGQAVSN